MSTIQDQIREHVPVGLKHGVFFKEQTHKVKNFFGFERTVRRLHLAMKDARGQTVILDEKGILLKKTSSMFGQTFRTTAESHRFKEYRVNSSSLKHFLTRLEGKNVTWIKERKDKAALGERILKATGELFKADLNCKVTRLIFTHSEGKIQADDRAREDLDQQIEALENREAELKRFLKTAPTVRDRLELQGVKRQLKQLDETRASDVADYSAIADAAVQLRECGIDYPTPHTVFSPGEVSVSWKVDRPSSPILSGGQLDAALDETNLDEEQLRIEQGLQADEAAHNWWVQYVEAKLTDLRKAGKGEDDPQVKHYKAVLAKRVSS